MFLNYILNDDSLIIVTDEGLKTLMKDNPYSGQVIEFLKKGKYDQALEMLDVANRVKRHSKGAFHVQDGKVLHKGTVMPEELSKRVIQFADLAIPFKPLIAFWENLLLNPSEDSRKDLFSFLMHNHIPLTEDGCFIGYKRVGEDWLDLHTHTIDNSVGKEVFMKRQDVDPDRKNTCSRGLHVAAFSYAQNMYSNGNLVAIKVNPKDVVAVPEDYNGEKMRVCFYTVMGKIDGPRKTIIYAEYRVGDEVVVFPNLDDAQNYFKGVISVVHQKEDQTPSYSILKDTGEIVVFPQHHVAKIGTETDEEEEYCPSCGEMVDYCTCDDEEYDDDDDDDCDCDCDDED